MLLKTKINIGLLFYFVVVVIIPSFPTLYTFFLDTVGTGVSLTSISIIYTFYFASVPPMHRTCIQGLSRLLLVCLSLVIIRSYLLSLMANVLHDLTQAFITEYPIVSCCLINSRVTYVPFLLSLLMLMVSRLGLLLCTMRFMSLHHEIIVKTCIAVTFGLPLMDLILSSTIGNFTCCNDFTMNTFARRNKFIVTIDIQGKTEFFFKPVPILTFTNLVFEMVFQAVIYYREAKMKKVNIFPISNQLLNPTVTSIRPPLNPATKTTFSTTGRRRISAPISSATTATSNIYYISGQLVAPLNPTMPSTSRARRSSYPNQVTEKASFRRFSVDSFQANKTNMLQTATELQVNPRNQRSPPGETLHDDPLAERTMLRQGDINIGHQIQQPPGETLHNNPLAERSTLRQGDINIGHQIQQPPGEKLHNNPLAERSTLRQGDINIGYQIQQPPSEKIHNNPLAERSTLRQGDINIGNQIQQPRSSKSHLSFIMIFLTTIIATNLLLVRHSISNVFIEYVVTYTLEVFVRLVQYCLPIFWIIESEEISEFTFTKSKHFLASLLSLKFFPMSVQNLANRLQ